MAKTETWKRAILQTAHMGTLYEEISWCLEKLPSNPELQGKA